MAIEALPNIEPGLCRQRRRVTATARALTVIGSIAGKTATPKVPAAPSASKGFRAACVSSHRLLRAERANCCDVNQSNGFKVSLINVIWSTFTLHSPSIKTTGEESLFASNVESACLNRSGGPGLHALTPVAGARCKGVTRRLPALTVTLCRSTSEFDV